MADDNEVTGLLIAWSEGDEDALRRLVPFVYNELREIAHHQMGGERDGHTLQTTGLVHELYLRLARSHGVSRKRHRHFLALSARLMRRILVDHARAKLTEKRGRDSPVMPLDEMLVFSDDQLEELVALDEAMTALAGFDKRKSRVVEMRHFGGFSVEETADVLGVSPDTVVRDWKLARSWLMWKLHEKTLGPRIG